MPVRQIPLVTGEIYHVCNRGIDRKQTFTSKREYQRASFVLQYYQYRNVPFRLSRFLSRTVDQRVEILRQLEKSNEKLVEFYSYCLMPNHYHFLIKQMTENGVSKFMSQFQNSYTKYFNTIHEKEGPLFLDQFKAVRIETDEQFVHVSRYIHINPYTAYIVKDFESLRVYRWSSLREYLDKEKTGLCTRNQIYFLFSSISAYGEFVFDQMDYQRELAKIKHLTLED